MRTPIYWITGPWRGRLAIIPRPRGGDWLEDEVRAWREAGIGLVVSLVEAGEAASLDITQEAAFCAANEIEYVAFPIPDRGVPASSCTFGELVRALENRLVGGVTVAIHCRQGIGRSGMLAASVLIAAGIEAGSALDRVCAARGCTVPETAEQREWILRFARELTPASAKER